MELETMLVVVDEEVRLEAAPDTTTPRVDDFTITF